MAEERVQRRLAAILAADVVGYSRLMEQDETGTLVALRGRRKTVLEPVVGRYQGRVFKVAGDGVLVEFASAVNAVQCAIDLQQEMAAANGETREDRHIVLRIGVNLGDVMVQGGDLYGDGINIAARLESLADADGILLSGSAYDQVRNKVDAGFEDLGSHSLKNIAQPVRIYRVRASGGTPTAARPILILPDKPSIAVLPFTNMSADTEQEFFADGLTEDLITELSKAPGLFVIARHSCFAFKNKSVDVRQVARELGVRYVLEGSARRSASRIRINAQLIDAREGGGHLWAERFDRDLADVFAIQDEVVMRIVEALVGRLAADRLPGRKLPRSLEAYDLCVRARFLYHRMEAPGGKEARQLFQRAVDIDPEYGEAHAYLAMTHWLGWSNWSDPVEPHRRLAIEHARRATTLDPNDPWAHTVSGFILAYEHQYDESAAEIDTALRLDPNHAFTHAVRADLLVMDGKPQEAISSVMRALRLDPRPPGWYYWLKGQAEYAARQYDAAIKTLRHEATYSTPSRSILAAALAQVGRVDEAHLEGRLFIADFPKWRIEEFLDTQPFRNPADRGHFAEGYRRAALPE